MSAAVARRNPVAKKPNPQGNLIFQTRPEISIVSFILIFLPPLFCGKKVVYTYNVAQVKLLFDHFPEIYGAEK